MIRSFWIGCSLIFLGLLWTGYPDKAPVLFAVIGNRGPSQFDLAGLAVAFLGWLFLLMKTISERKRVVALLGADGIKRMILIIVLGKGLVYVGLRINLQLLLWTGVLVMLLAYVALFIPAFRKN
ncbi:MAG: hypothetical protein ACOYW3_00650 [Bacteroidota bacterium]